MERNGPRFAETAKIKTCPARDRRTQKACTRKDEGHGTQN
jgi:hypothetical protein